MLQRSSGPGKGTFPRWAYSALKVGVAILVSAVVFLLGFIVGIAHERRTSEFDWARWKSAATERLGEERYDMLGNFLSSHNICGMRKKEVLNLLGPPSPDYPYASDSVISYRMGEGYLDDYWLVLTVSEDRVTSYAVLWI